MAYYLVVYDKRLQRLLAIDEFAERDQERAVSVREQREEAELANPHVEVVLFRAESEAALRRTHARYFETVSEIASRKL